MKQVGTEDWDRGEIEYIRKHSSQFVFTCSENAARDAVWARILAMVKTCINVLLTSATENESPQSPGAAHVGDTVLSSKWARKVFSLSGRKTLVFMTWLVFPCKP